MTDERAGRYLREARFFLAGDKVAAQSHILDARSLMGYLRDMHALGGPPIQVKYATLADGTQIKAAMMNGQYQAEIVSPVRVAEETRKIYRGGIICRPNATHPVATPYAPTGWGEPFTYDDAGHTVSATEGGAHPYVIFDPTEGGKVQRWPEIQDRYPKLVADPLYGAQINYWRSRNFNYVWSHDGAYSVFHRGKQIVNAYADIPGTATVPARIVAIGEWTAYPDAGSTAVAVFVLIRHDSLVGGVRTRLMKYSGTRSSDGDGVTFSSVSTLWTSSSAFLPFSRSGVFNLDGTRVVFWEGDGADGPMTSIMVLNITDPSTVTPALQAAPVASESSDALVWRNDAPCMLIGRTTNSEYHDLDSGAVVQLFSGEYSGTPDVVHSVFTAILAADQWVDKYVVRIGARDSTGGALPVSGSWSWTTAFVVDSIVYPFLQDSNNPPLQYWIAAVGDSPMAHRFLDVGERLDNNCSGVTSIHQTLYAAFGADDILVSMYTDYDPSAAPLNLLDRSMWYFDGESVHNAASLLGVDHLTNITDCASTGRPGSHFHYVGLI